MTVSSRCLLLVVVALAAFSPLVAAGDDGPKKAGARGTPAPAGKPFGDGEGTSWEAAVLLRGALAGLRSPGEFIAGSSHRGFPDLTRRHQTAASEGTLVLPTAVAQGSPGSSGIQVELFGRAGLALLNASAEDSLGLAAGIPGAVEPLYGSQRLSEFGWGGGARLMWGDWGVEGTYSTLDSLALSPGWLFFDEAVVVSGTPEAFFPMVASRANVFLGQVVRTFPLSNSTEWFVGLGGGWMRAADTDDLFVVTPMPNDLDDYPTGLPADSFAGLVPEVELTADRSSVVYAGSVGLLFRRGRVVFRPRVDIIIARALTTELTVGFDLPDVEEVDGVDFVYTSSVTPTIFLVSVDIGLSN